MAIFGGGVRPELGRTDYSAIARGSEVAAQMAGRGAEAMGRGLAGALESAGAAIKERKGMEAEVKAASALGKALTGVQGIPEDVKQAAANVIGQLESSDLSVRAKNALAKQVTAQFGSFLDAGMKAEENAARQKLLAEQTRLTGLQATAIEIKQKDQSALAQALKDNAPIPGEPIDFNSVKQSFLEGGGQNVELVDAVAQSSLKTGFKPSTMTFELSDGSPIDVVMVSPNSAQVVPRLNADVKIPARMQEITYRYELGKRIPELLREGKDDEAIAIAVALNYKNPWGATDGAYLRSQFAIEEKQENQDDVAKARAIIKIGK